jgi:hypothetical protein
MEEVHRVGVAAVFAADADLEIGAGGAATFGADLDESPTPSTSRVSKGLMPKMPISR